MKLSEELRARGFIYQSSTDEIDAVLDGVPQTIYLGIDPTADAIHVGNLVPYLLLNRLQRAGHQVILLLGGGTALIGDPGGKSEERPFVEPEVIAAQAAKMEASVRRFVDSGVRFVNNLEWLQKLSMLEFLRDVGKHFTVNAMIKKDIVANRLTEDSSISYTEFSYSLLQAYDFYHLHTEYGCTMQIGGSDQWSNIIAGVDYIRRRTGQQVYGLTMPLVTDKATGKKFGKSEGNAIWLDPEKTSPYEFYQFWLNTSDESVIDYLKLFTDLSLDAIATLTHEQQQNPGARVAQKRLAEEVTKFVHDEKEMETSREVADVLFGEEKFVDLSPTAVQVSASTVGNEVVANNTLLVDVLVRTELAKSKREARTFIESGAIQLNNEKITDTEAVVTGDSGDRKLLQRGKKQHVVIEIS